MRFSTKFMVNYEPCLNHLQLIISHRDCWLETNRKLDRKANNFGDLWYFLRTPQQERNQFFRVRGTPLRLCVFSSHFFSMCYPSEIGKKFFTHTTSESVPFNWWTFCCIWKLLCNWISKYGSSPPSWKFGDFWLAPCDIATLSSAATSQRSPPQNQTDPSRFFSCWLK